MRTSVSITTGNSHHQPVGECDGALSHEPDRDHKQKGADEIANDELAFQIRRDENMERDQQHRNHDDRQSGRGMKRPVKMGKQRMAIEEEGGEEQQVRKDRLDFERQATEHQRRRKTKGRRKISDTPIAGGSVTDPLQEQEHHAECQHDEGEKIGEIILQRVLPGRDGSLNPDDTAMPLKKPACLAWFQSIPAKILAAAFTFAGARSAIP